MELISGIDRSVMLFLDSSIGNAFLDAVMKFISALGNGGFIWILLALVLVFMGGEKRKYGILMFLCLGLNALIGNVILKPLVARDRPFQTLMLDIIINAPKDFSFPSGHTSSSFTAALVIYAMNKKYGVAAVIFAVCMGLSRLYLLVHYPSDVIFGAVLGSIVSVLVLSLARRRGYIKQ